MTREEYDKEMLTIKSNLDIVPIMHKYISSLEQYIAELEAPKTCKTCKWHKDKQCTNFNSIAFSGDNAVYEDDYCNDYEPKDNND